VSNNQIREITDTRLLKQTKKQSGAQSVEKPRGNPNPWRNQRVIRFRGEAKG
jgi:hypothetical protein